jgi:hypothetical protein
VSDNVAMTGVHLDKLARSIGAYTFSLATLFSAFFLAWLSLAQADFLYPLWYKLIDIDRNISQYAPKNRYRLHFETTSAAEHARLFADIVDAVHCQGKGLEHIVYRGPDGRTIRLLTEPEVVHLRDVARLIDLVRPIGWSAVVVWALLVVFAIGRRLALPSTRRVMVAVTASIVVLCVVTLLLGPVDTFYRLHTWIFPAGHQWYFYYEDSLMSTLMKAPDLFGYIAITWLALSLLLMAAMLWLVGWIVPRRASS